MTEYILNSSASAPSLIKLPERQVVASIRLGQQPPTMGTDIPAGVAVFANSEHASAARINHQGVDLTYSLIAMKNSIEKECIRMGRLWTMHYPIQFTAVNGAPLMTQRIDLAPAYAGFKHGIVDRAALQSLAAISQSFHPRGTNETIPDDARTGIARLLGTPMELSRLLLRLAVMYAAAATAEAMGGGLRLTTNNDNRPPRFLQQLGDWATAVLAASATTEQPVYLGVRGLNDSQRYLRIARALALDSPSWATSAHGAAPSVLAIWPEIPNARAYALASTATAADLAGDLAARDIAMYAQYLGNVYGVTEHYEHWLQFALGMATRPAGSAALGSYDHLILSLPAASQAPLVLSPLTQATNTLTDEYLEERFEYAAPLIFAGATRGATFLACLNCVMMQTGHYWATQDTPVAKRAAVHSAQYVKARLAGSAAATSALNMAADIGWDKSFTEPWLRIAVGGSAKRYLPVEAEETVPFTTAHPANSAILGILRPSALAAPVPVDLVVPISKVQGRANISDGFYSLLVTHPDIKIHNVTVNMIEQRTMVAPAKILKSYRRAPTDGQFSTLRTETAIYRTAFKLNTTRALAAALHAKERSHGVTWYYEWNIPHTNLDMYEQFIEDGYIPPEPEEVPVEPKEDYVQMSPPKVTLKDTEKKDVEHYRDLLGTALGNIIDTMANLTLLSGKQLHKSQYESETRLFTGYATSLDPEMMEMALATDLDAQRVLFGFLKTACLNAAEWETRPTSRDEAIAKAEIYGAMLAAVPLSYDECVPPDERGKPIQNINPFTATQLNWNDEVNRVEAAAYRPAQTAAPAPSEQETAPAAPPAEPPHEQDFGAATPHAQSDVPMHRHGIAEAGAVFSAPEEE